jgi:hypothetical protein
MTSIAATKVGRVVSSKSIDETAAFREIAAFLSNHLGSGLRNSDDPVENLLPVAESLATTEESAQVFQTLKSATREDTSALAPPLKFEIMTPTSLKQFIPPTPATTESMDTAAPSATVQGAATPLREWKQELQSVTAIKTDATTAASKEEIDQPASGGDTKILKRKAKKEGKKAKKAMKKVKMEV